MQLVLKRKKTPNGTWEKGEWYIRNAKKEKILHTRNMDTWLLLYPTTKAWVSLKFYTTITLNIQFLNVFTEPAMHYRGALLLKAICALKKKKSGVWNKGLKCFVQCWLFVLRESSNLQSLQLPTEHSTAPIQQWGGQQRRRSSCVCVQRRNDREMWTTSGGGKEDKANRVFFFCLCMFLFKVIKYKTTTKNVHLPVLSKLWH